jgi:hypothetical protein
MTGMARLLPAWLLVAAAAMQPVLAADLEPSPERNPPPQTAPAGDPFAPPDAACLEWTDGCRTCQRPPSGEIACSNVGVACVPQPLRCTRR